MKTGIVFVNFAISVITYTYHICEIHQKSAGHLVCTPTGAVCFCCRFVD
jgi:hypothetical protein